jgi:hypothetical protein
MVFFEQKKCQKKYFLIFLFFCRKRCKITEKTENIIKEGNFYHY